MVPFGALKAMKRDRHPSSAGQGVSTMNLARVIGPLIAFGLAVAPVLGQEKLASPPSSAGTPAVSEPPPPAGDKPDFKPEELEQMLAPVALYPDSLLSQVFMAATYPIEVVEADRWVKANEALKGEALAKALEPKPWDASVKSLVNFPQILAMMSEKLDVTVKIGDAFIGQQKEVMDTVQKLRAKAKSTGNLESGKEQVVTTQKTDTGTQVIVIESSSPDVIYVPQYNPTVVYGSWPYPAYPPYPYYPPGYVAHHALSFGLGVACGVAWGYAWGNCNWGHGDINIDCDRNVNRNRNIDRERTSQRQKADGGRGQGSFKHDPSHRQGAAYRNNGAAQRVGAGSTSNRAAQARTDYRGRAEAGRADISRGGANSFKGNTPSNRAGAGATRAPSTANRAATTGGGSSAFGGTNRSGSDARAASNRGSASRSSSPSMSRSSPSRSSGGASRGGGRSGGGRGGGRR